MRQEEEDSKGSSRMSSLQTSCQGPKRARSTRVMSVPDHHKHQLLPWGNPGARADREKRVSPDLGSLDSAFLFYRC